MKTFLIFCVFFIVIAQCFGQQIHGFSQSKAVANDELFELTAQPKKYNLNKRNIILPTYRPPPRQQRPVWV